MSSDTPDRYALVGHPVSHSHSPVIHGLFAKQLGEKLTYELIDATAEEFEVAVRGFRAAGGKGLNVTVPHKERAYALATAHGTEAEEAQAANTLSFAGHTIIADNTDGIGLVRDLTQNLSFDLQGKRVLILGAGGAARGIICPLLHAGVRQLTVANRTLERATKLQSLLGRHGAFDICSFAELDGLDAQDLVINATSAGVKGEQAPFPESLFTAVTFCYDLSYSVKDTPFVTLARAYGAEYAVQGWGMLIEQAAESYRIWRGKRPDTAPLLERMMR